MTPQQIEAMKLALEALEYALNKPMWNRPKMTVAITALEEVLAQPEQIQPSADSNTHQPERHELQAKGEHPAPCARHCEANAFQIVIKNLKAQLAQPEQEPVPNRLFLEKMLAAMEGVIDVADRKTDEFEALRRCVVDLTLMLHSTPQRTWVGLTDEDMYVVSEEESCSFIAGAKWSEEILKEKNAICSPFMISELWRLNK